MSPIKPENRVRYPIDWPTISLKIRERAERRCECEGECRSGHRGRCVRAQGDHLLSGGMVVLTVAHLDHTPEHCEPGNLRAMCQRCHLTYDAKHHAQTAAATRRTRREDAGQLALERFLPHDREAGQMAIAPPPLKRKLVRLKPLFPPGWKPCKCGMAIPKRAKKCAYCKAGL